MKAKKAEDRPVFVFDSGVGGVSVLKELTRLLPHEDFDYFGDCKNAPYGTKTEEEVRAFTEAALDDAIARGAKAAVIACNTATAAAAKYLRAKRPDFPIIGIEPAIKPAAEQGGRPKVLIMATPMTLSLEKFRVLEQSLEDKADFAAFPCGGLVELIEAGKADEPETEEFIRTLLAPQFSDPPDAVVLGCTHYPFVKKALKRIFGEEMRFYDGAEGTARQLKRVLEARGLLSGRKTRGQVRFSASGDDPMRAALMKELFLKPL